MCSSNICYTDEVALGEVGYLPHPSLPVPWGYKGNGAMYTLSLLLSGTGRYFMYRRLRPWTSMWQTHHPVSRVLSPATWICHSMPVLSYSPNFSETKLDPRWKVSVATQLKLSELIRAYCKAVSPTVGTGFKRALLKDGRGHSSNIDTASSFDLF